MTDNIFGRLRCTYAKDGWPCEECTFCAARAEINRLRAENQRIRRVFEETIRILNSGGDDAR